MYNSDYYKILLFPNEKLLEIKLEMLTPYVNTSKLRHTYNFFEKNLPSILKSQCFNENNYNFSQEIINTELGHLFEHILLENLCKEKLLNGHKNASFSGYTSWNWKIEKPGNFNIKINIEPADKIYLDSALEKTCELFIRLLNDKSN